jgi:class 3 adenylate cyclase
MTQVVDDALSAGREAAARGAWREAYDLLSPAAGSLSPEDLEALAEAAYWLGKLDEAIGLREQAQAAWVEAGEPRKAALVALTVSGDYFMKGDFAVASGWFGKAARLLDGLDESIEHGYLAVSEAMNAMMTGDLDDVIARAEKARSLAKRFESRDLEAMTLVVQGRALVLKGDATRGLALLDEATAAAVSGELRPFSTGFIYCVTITSCHGLGDYRRAREWTKAAGRWCDRSDIKGFPGACRVHQATVKRLAGDWPEAEEQALQACEETQGYDAWTTAAGFYEIGEIRRRRGDFAAAEDSYRMAKEWGADPQPGIAFLRLAQGKVEAASSAIKRSLTSTGDPLGRIRRLPAQVEIALATGDLKTAREAASELEELTQTFRVGDEPTPAFQATTCLAWGQIRLAEGDPQGAAEELARSVSIWREIGIPYETAEAQLLLGVALRKLGDDEGANEELTDAKATLERLGAVLAAQRAAELLGEVPLTRTFMFTDIVDSTKLAEALGEAKWEKLLAWHDRTLRELLTAQGGEVIKQTGDGFFAAFDSPGTAVEAAVAVQRSLAGHDGISPDVRIGLHAGEAFSKDEVDFGGHGVHAAARIGALAGAGEIVASAETLAHGAVSYGVSEPRSAELKGISELVDVVSIDWR